MAIYELALATAKTVKSAVYIIIVLSLLNPATADSNHVSFVGPILGDKILTEESNGFYADMFRQIMEGQEATYKLVALPFRRTLADFASKEFDCIWSLDKSLLSRVGLDVTDLIESEVVFESTQHIFLAPGSPKISSLDDLTGKRIGIGSGSSYEQRLKDISAKVVLLSDQDSKLRLFENDRVDAIIGWVPSLYIMINDTTSNPNLLENSFKLSSSNISFVCHNTESNAAFITWVNEEIRAYKTSGQFLGLFESYGASQMLEDQNK